MKTRRIFAGVVGATMALTLAGAAFAVVEPAQNTFLHQTGTAIVATGGGDCSGHEPGAGEITWHFIMNQTNNSVTDFGRFAFASGVVYQDSEPQGSNVTWWITTGNTTLNGSQTWNDGTTTGNFNLSHTCLGETVSTPTPTLPNETATPTLPVETATPTLPTNETPTPTLPQTSTIDQSNTGGPGTSLTLVFALILAVAGGLMAYAMRPRRVGNR